MFATLIVVSGSLDCGELHRLSKVNHFFYRISFPLSNLSLIHTFVSDEPAHLLDALPRTELDYTRTRRLFITRPPGANLTYLRSHSSINMDDDTIAQFTSITKATPERAKQYLTVSDFDLEQAIQLYFESGGVDMGGAATDTSTTNTAGGGGAGNPITIDDDDDDDDLGGRPSVEDDEAMARRMQQEMYGAQGAGDEQDIRAPQARTAQTLLGPDSDDWRNDPDEMHAAVLEQMRRRQRPGMLKIPIAH